MKNKYIVLSEKSTRPLAEKYFVRSCGINDREGKAFHRRIKDKVKIKCIIGCADVFSMKDNTVTIDQETFRCDAFRSIDPKAVEKICLYIVTSGEYKLETENEDELFYADAWGTAYVQAAQDMVKEIIREDYEGRGLSDSFGPGYGGMPIEELKKFFVLLDSENVGISYNESGIMFPLKTLAGVYFVGDHEKK